MRKFLAVGALVLLALATTSCVPGGDEPDASSGDSNPVVLTPDSAPAAMREAGIDGVVELRGDCFVLASNAGSWLIEWPYGTRLGSDKASVENDSFGVVEIGDTIHGGGGYGTNVDGCLVDGVEGTASIDEITEVD